MLALPKAWPWEAAWTTLFDSVSDPPPTLAAGPPSSPVPQTEDTSGTTGQLGPEIRHALSQSSRRSRHPQQADRWIEAKRMVTARPRPADARVHRTLKAAGCSVRRLLGPPAARVPPTKTADPARRPRSSPSCAASSGAYWEPRPDQHRRPCGITQPTAGRQLATVLTTRQRASGFAKASAVWANRRADSSRNGNAIRIDHSAPTSAVTMKTIAVNVVDRARRAE